jgi:hypothetical protein
MKNKLFGFNISTIAILAIAFVMSSVINAQDIETLDSASEQSNEVLNIVQNTNSQTNIPPPPSGTIILPDSLVNNPEEEKNCMTVCARWGEDCTYINRGIGGMTRSCRRTCQQFKEECF